jgi:hypothetical protein
MFFLLPHEQGFANSSQWPTANPQVPFPFAQPTDCRMAEVSGSTATGNAGARL